MPLSRKAGVRQRGALGGGWGGHDAVCKSTSINVMACLEGTAAPVAGTAVWASLGCSPSLGYSLHRLGRTHGCRLCRPCTPPGWGGQAGCRPSVLRVLRVLRHRLLRAEALSGYRATTVLLITRYFLMKDPLRLKNSLAERFED